MLHELEDLELDAARHCELSIELEGEFVLQAQPIEILPELRHVERTILRNTVTLYALHNIKNKFECITFILF